MTQSLDAKFLPNKTRKNENVNFLKGESDIFLCRKCTKSAKIPVCRVVGYKNVNASSAPANHDLVYAEPPPPNPPPPAHPTRLPAVWRSLRGAKTLLDWILVSGMARQTSTQKCAESVFQPCSCLPGRVPSVSKI